MVSREREVGVRDGTRATQSNALAPVFGARYALSAGPTQAKSLVELHLSPERSAETLRKGVAAGVADIPVSEARFGGWCLVISEENARKLTLSLRA